MFTAGPAMRWLHEALPESRRGAWAEDADALIPMVTGAVRDGDIVMVKGSNGSRASKIAKALADMGPGGDA